MHYNYVLFKQRCESFNSVVRAENVFSNKHSPSRDIATKFGVEESIRNICLGISDKYVLNTHTKCVSCYSVKKVWCWTCGALSI